MSEKFEQLEKDLGVFFKNKNLLIQAFCHRSYLNENKGFDLEHNERLEFLGDAVLELVITEHLYQNYDIPEGEMTNLRAALVNSQSLSKIASEVGFEDYLLLSKGEEKDKGKARQYILANTMEAFLGSLYLDQGLEKCREFISEHFIKELPRILKEGTYRDAKSLFQEKAQEMVGVTPSYKVLKEWGPDHEKNFVLGVFLEDKLIAEGEGSSKQEAEEEAASRALEAKNW